MIEEFDPPLIPVAGTRLFVEVAGRGEENVIFIHGFSLDTRMWDDQFEVLGTRYRVVRYDMRGFGRSDLPIGGDEYTAQDDLKALMEKLGISSASFIGLSLGGGVAIDFALTYPKMVSKLVLVDSIVGGWRWSTAWTRATGSVWNAGRNDGPDAARKLWLQMPIFAPALEAQAVAEQLRRMIDDYSGWDWVNHDPQIHLDPPTLQRLSEMTAPTLVLVGERDEPDFLAIADTLTRQIPNARKAIISGAGHMANMEAWEEFNRIVLEFLESDLPNDGRKGQS